ncbi:MAG: WYL domain-containing protein, partial [Lachnospiraceae bacterium]|nr:WYL domain-containing protein [Lachnospiraceae bacterium]
SEEEKQEILTALQSINLTNNIGINQTLQKLSAIFRISSENWLEVDFSRWGNKGTDNEKFELLKSAIICQKCVKIIYANSCGTISERIVQPLKMSYKSMSWYLKAYCREKQGYRMFKLTRIIDLEVLTESFYKSPFPELEETLKQSYNTIVLHFPQNMSYRVYDEFDKTRVSKKENGDLIVSVEMPEDEWLIGYLLSFGTQVDIIEPVYLRDIVAEQARKIYEKYTL